jgi:predicted DNA-binding protein (MmcQ/YjbR family)
MNIDFLQQICEQFPGVTTDIKWGHDLVFSVAEKMFCVCSTDPPFRASFKVNDEEFEEISLRDGFQPAPYMARAKWVLVTEPGKLNRQEWESFIAQSYELVKSKLSNKTQLALGKARPTGSSWRVQGSSKVQEPSSKKKGPSTKKAGIKQTVRKTKSIRRKK